MYGDTPKNTFVIISLGAGVQSYCMYLMACLGCFGRVDCAIFADTQSEPHWVYDALDYLEKTGGHIIPIIRETSGNLGEDWFSGQVSRRDPNTLVNGASLPVHLKGENGKKGMGARTCTSRYKMIPLRRAIRRFIGVRPGARVPDSVHVRSLIGISIDEAQRMKPAKEKWITHIYPLIDAGMSRADCLMWIQDAGRPRPKRSACYFCPYRSDAEWRDLQSSPEEWARAVIFDERLRSQIRYLSAAATEKSVWRGVPFLHASLKPLSEVKLKGGDEPVADQFNNECEGMCGV